MADNLNNSSKIIEFFLGINNNSKYNYYFLIYSIKGTSFPSL